MGRQLVDGRCRVRQGLGTNSSRLNCCTPTLNALGSSSAFAISARLAWAGARPLQVIKYWARFSTTPMRFSSGIPNFCTRRAAKMRSTLLGPMPGTRSSSSLLAVLTSTGKNAGAAPPRYTWDPGRGQS